MPRLFLIRHGKPAAAWGGHDDDPGLEPEGEAQAEYAARTLLMLPTSERPIAVASSPMRRCLETARPLADALGVRVEIVPEVGEIPTPRALEAAARGPWLRQALQGRWSAIDGDLDYEAWRQGVTAAVRARPGTAIFSHFVAINAVVSLLGETDTVTVFRPGYASTTTLDIVGGDLRLVSRGSEAATGVL
ncbi:MAG TPA: histidine phosphatase family protein [Caulobacteraceae bacterium]